MKNSQKEIYFHVGLAKTGSTFLQNSFFPKLKNIKYISTHRYWRCISIIKRTKYKSYLISREFDRQFEYEIKKILKEFPQTKIIVVFRRHDKWISSQFKRHSKNGYHWEFEDFYNNQNTGFWRKEDMLYSTKIKLIKKYSKNTPLVLRFEDLKENPHSYLKKISNFTKSTYSREDISLSVVHSSWSDKQLIFLKKFCRIFKKTPPEYYANNKVLHWILYRPWWLLFHFVMYFAYFLPKSFVIKKPLIDKVYLSNSMKKYAEDWEKIKKISV